MGHSCHARLEAIMSPEDPMMIEILYFDGCPNHEPTLELAREVVAELGLDAEIHQVRIETPEEAAEERPGAPGGEDLALGCRLYGTSGVPPKQLLVDAIRGG